MHNPWNIGDTCNGFQSGMFGRDSYANRIVEAVGPDWIVTRDEYGKPEYASAPFPTPVIDVGWV